MYAVTVQFTLDSRHVGSFIPLMLENARVWRETERGCRSNNIDYVRLTTGRDLGVALAEYLGRREGK